MSNYQDQYSTGAAQTDEYGNPIHHGTTGTHTGGRTTGYDSAPTQQSAGGYGTGHESGYGAGTGGHGTGHESGYGAGTGGHGTGHESGYGAGTGGHGTGHESGYGAGTGGYGTGGGAGHDAYGTGGGVGHDAYGTGTGTGLGATHQTGGHGTGGQYGTTTGTGGTFDSTTATGRHGQPHHRRSGSGSSSSSEDDGQGGRRKKGLKEKIKDKLPGGHKDQYQEQGGQYTTGTTPASGGAYYDQSTGTGQQPEKRGFIDKIKDKLPGSH